MVHASRRPSHPRLASLALLAPLFAGCSDDGTATATGTDSSTSTGSSSSGPMTTGTTTGTPTTSDSSSGTDSGGETTTGDPTSGTTGTTTTGTTTTGTTTTDTTTTDTTTTDTTSTSSTSTDGTSTGDTSTGVLAECGNGVIEDGEQCDDAANNGPGQACLDGCIANVCGDGDQGPQEGCDDGNVSDRDGCSAKCVSESCGDGVTQAGLGEACDDGNVVDEDGCSSKCIAEICGDGVVQKGLGEACDDGDLEPGDGCDANCQIEAPASLCDPGTISVLVNEGFEAGVFAPWTSNTNATTVVMNNPHSGTWTAETVGNFYVQQTFAAVPVAQFTSARFWTWHDAADNPAMYVEWGYSDNTTGNIILANQQLDGWQEHNILANLDAAKSLVRLTVWGYSGGGNLADVAHFDDFRLCKTP